MRIVFLQNFIDVLRGRKVYAKFLKKKYDVVFSLGNNCELCIRLRDDFFGINFESFLFNWTAILDRDKFLELLNGDMRKIVDDDFSEYYNGNDIFFSKYYQIGVHARYNPKELEGNLAVQKEAIISIKSKLNHLIDKTENLFNSDKSIIFIAKVMHKSFEDDYNYIEKLFNILQRKLLNFEKRKIKFLFVVQKEDYDDIKFEELCLKFKHINKKLFEIKRVKSFADISIRYGDKKGWVKILRKEIFY